MARRNALGRGLGALIPEEPRASEPAAETTPRGDEPGVAEIPVDRIDPNPEQPRRVFDPDEIELLSESISRHGVLQPVVVRRAGDRFELVVGERRFRASQAAGRETIPAVVADVAEADRLELALVENVQRQDLNPIELALAFTALCDAGATQEEVGRRVGLDRSSVANHLRLLDLSRDLQQDVETGALTTGHAKALLQVANPERRRHLRDKIVEAGLSVRQAEELARGAAAPSRRKKSPRAGQPVSPELQNVVDLLREHLKTQVRVQGDGTRGRIEIEYFGAEDLTRIVNAMLEGR